MARANARGQPADLADRAEVEAAPPHERPDRGEEALARRNVARRRSRTDERRALPRQRRAFVMRQRAFERDRQRAYLGRRAQPQVDAENIAVGGHLAQQADQFAGIALRGLGGLVALAAGEAGGVVEQDRINVGAVVELARAVLAERERDQPGRLGFGYSSGDDRADRGIERAVGEGAQFAPSPFAAGMRRRGRRSPAWPPAPDVRAVVRGRTSSTRCAARPRPCERGRALARFEQCGQLGLPVERMGEERRVCCARARSRKSSRPSHAALPARLPRRKRRPCGVAEALRQARPS